MQVNPTSRKPGSRRVGLGQKWVLEAQKRTEKVEIKRNMPKSRT